MIMSPRKRPNMNSRFIPSASSRTVHDMNASQRTDMINRIIRAAYTGARRLSNWKSALVLLLLLVPTFASAATLLPPGKNCFYDSNGYPLAGGTVQFYIPSTTTPKDTWQNSGQTVLNTNPVVLDSAGCGIIYGSGVYRQVLKDSLGNLVWDQLTSDTSGLQISWGGVSTGTVNAQVLPSSGNFSQQSGQVVGFTAGLTNTGAATVSVGGSAIPVVTDTKTGPNSLTAGQITTGNLVAMMYDQVGGKFHILNVPRSYTAPTFSLNIQYFSTSGTYTPSANLAYAEVTCTGGAGGGGGVAASSNAGSGGGGGGGATSIIALSAATIGASQTVTIGAAGNGGAAGNNAGTAGGDTSLGSLCVAKGGSGGGGAAANTFGTGGTGGLASGGTGTIKIAGGDGSLGGQSASSSTNTRGFSGFGGGSFWGPGAPGVNTGAQLSGLAATVCGGGGSGGDSWFGSTAAGGNGFAGCVAVREYIFTAGGI